MFGLGKKGKNDIDVIEAYDLIIENKSDPKLVILDVRTPDEYNSEKIEDSININFNSGNFKMDVNELEKTKKYLVYCRSGRRSANALKEMKKLGFEDVLNISGGIMKWNSKGLPMK